jgi:putative transposase
MHDPFRYVASSPDVIRLAVTLSIRYPPSLRQVEDLPFERGIAICRETVRFWWARFAARLAAKTGRRRPGDSRAVPQRRWRLDEDFVTNNGEIHGLWRAVDREGEALEVVAAKRRGRTAALAFL